MSDATAASAASPSFEFINADIFDVAAELGEFDYIVTDPPYPTGGESSMRSLKSILECRQMIDAMAQTFIGQAIKSIRLAETCGVFILSLIHI